ncbi:tudor domain-containing protein [Aureococcus anophagefferens]|nr:tudor domain-containing protein [Aureococcus anophagefferens]
MDNSLDFSMSQSGAVDFPSVNTPSKKDALAVGAAVEARHNGGRKWYPGKISKAHDDGTFDVAYDDGDRESGVVKEFVRPAGGSPRRSPRRGKHAAGARVEARYRGKSKFYPGKIAKANDDGSYDIAYDDGESEANVIEALIRPLGGAGAGGAFAVGAAVQARYRGKSKLYPGKVAKDNGDGTYDIDYDDGEKESNVAEALIKASAAAPAATGTGGAFAVGAKVEARYCGKSKYYAGVIAKDNGDGTYDIDYDDGEKESKVEARYRGKSKYYVGVIAKDNGDGTYDIDYDDGEKESKVAEALIKASAAAAAAAPAAGKGGAFAVGAKVEARYRGKSKYYAGVIAKDNGDGTYDIDYDDGEKESKVAEALIKASAPAPAATGTGGAFAVGAKVEARYRGKSKYYAGVIAKDNGDGTYDIDYDDGEKETKVAEALIKASAAAPAPAAGKGGAFAVGAKVEAKYRGKSKYYAGVIATDNGDGTYNIDYDDGEKETKVAEALIKASAAAPAPAATGTGGAFAVGAKVEARYRGKSKYYAGVIAVDNGDGTYNIDYDDGEKETKVAEALIKASAAAPAPAAGKGGAFPVGAKVEAKYRGKSKYYAGVIAADNGDGTYNIDYDDGEKETKVAEALIKASAAAPAPAATGTGGAFAVEARYRGKSKFYAGVIAVDNGDGTYNIDYDDGEKETKVAEALIKASAAAPAATGTGGAFAVGAKVEARYRGKSKYYAGVIAVDNGDGTYNIDYDDGEKESKVAEALIKASAAAVPAAGKGGAFAVGAKVEARYRGKSKYYAGVIAADNGDGTYNIDYDDGEKETKVAEALIKASAPAPAPAPTPAAPAPAPAPAAPAPAPAAAAEAGDQLTSLEESQRSTNKLFAAAAALKKTESMASVNAAENLAAAARDLESSTDALAAAGLRAAAQDLNREAVARAEAHMREAAAEDAAAVKDALRSAAAATDGDAAAAAAAGLAADAREDARPTRRRAASRPSCRDDDGENRPRTAEARRLARHGSYGDARHCVFRPKTRKDPNSEVKESSDGEGNDAEAKADNFIQRQDAWTRKVRREKEAAIGKAHYDVKLDKKVCPNCGAVQSYDEVEEKRDRCVECAVAYTRKNKGDIDGFLESVEARRREAECKMDALARDVDHGRSVGAKRVFRDGRVVTEPLFPERQSECAWDAFYERLEADLVRRRDHADDRAGLARSGPAALERHDPRDDLDECTFQPSIFRSGAAATTTTRLRSRLEEDVKRRHDKHAAHGREDSHCKRWFQRQYNDGVRQPHYHDDGIAGKRVIPEAKWRRGPPAPEGPAAPSGTISVESGLAETLSAQRQSRLVDEQQKALEAEVERRVTVATAERVLAASAAWESERRGLLEARERELREAEASQLDHVKAQVALLHSKYDFVRPPPVPRCLAEERDVLKCYEDNKGGDVLKCAKLVDAYSACARRVADDLARSLQQS